jgi:hypothetical protein
MAVSTGTNGSDEAKYGTVAGKATGPGAEIPGDESSASGEESETFAEPVLSRRTPGRAEPEIRTQSPTKAGGRYDPESEELYAGS